MSTGSFVSNRDLEAKRAVLRDRYRNALTCEQTMRHRRLLNAGRSAEAQALIKQAEQFFLAAHEALERMNACELVAFERAIALDNAAGLHQVVAAVLLRSEREVRHRQIEAPLLGLDTAIG